MAVEQREIHKYSIQLMKIEFWFYWIVLIGRVAIDWVASFTMKILSISLAVGFRIANLQNATKSKSNNVSYAFPLKKAYTIQKFAHPFFVIWLA